MSALSSLPPSLPEDYDRIAAAIAFIQAHRHEQPNLATIAHHVHLSESHFQRLFSRWAGVSPKRFLQLLTVEQAKRRLETSRSLLALSLETGLSSSSRLHDLFVSLEAMTPADYRKGGQGLEMVYGIVPTRFGQMLVATTAKGICNLQFLDHSEHPLALNWLRAQWPQASIHHDPTALTPIAQHINDALTTHPPKPLPLLVKGTNFQIQVWRALINLPFGSLTTYQDIAQSIGKPQAARAVGTAIGANPVAYLIPCHRVIRSNGELGGYRWGLPRKSTLLGWEASQLETTHHDTTSGR